MSTGNIPLFELDVAVPSQLYMIEYSLVERGSLPFVPDFLLKLLHVADFLPQEVAHFFGFSRKELDHALTGFFSSGEVEYRKDGKLGLTAKGHALFSDNDTSPMRESIANYRKPFCFDLLTFSYLGTNSRSGRDSRTLRLKVDQEQVAESQRLAKESFQRNIHDIYKKGHLVKGAPQGGTPEIYKFSDCSKRKDFVEKVPEVLSLNAATYQFEFEDGDGLPESETYIRARTEALSAACGSNNINQISKVADLLEDEFTLRLIQDEGLNADRLASLAIDELQGHGTESERRRLYGSLQLKRNWQDIFEKLKSTLKSDKTEKAELIWLAPSCHELWGKCERHGQALSEVYELFSKHQSGINGFKIYVPLPDDRDKRAKNIARRENAEAGKRLFGFVESELLSSVEILLLKDKFVAVLYHFTDSSRYPAPVPIGFFSQSAQDLARVHSFMVGALGEYTEAGAPRDLGLL
tara:strand:- start:1338 stop:2735 length:1398 start_codon:yes stop_codon:yes gene_type:complete